MVWFIDHRNLIHTVLEAGTSMVGFWREPFPGLQTVGFSLCPHMIESRERKQALSSTLVKAPNPIHGGSTLMSSSNPNCPPDAIILEDRVSLYDFWRDTNICLIKLL